MNDRDDPARAEPTTHRVSAVARSTVTTGLHSIRTACAASFAFSPGCSRQKSCTSSLVELHLRALVDGDDLAACCQDRPRSSGHGGAPGQLGHLVDPLRRDARIS